jgi:hypothetical protein
LGEEKKRQKLKWAGPTSGNFRVISTHPDILVPLNGEVRIGLGEDKVGVLRLLFAKSNVAMQVQAGVIVVRKEDGFVMERLRFTIMYDEVVV